MKTFMKYPIETNKQSFIKTSRWEVLILLHTDADSRGFGVNIMKPNPKLPHLAGFNNQTFHFTYYCFSNINHRLITQKMVRTSQIFAFCRCLLSNQSMDWTADNEPAIWQYNEHVLKDVTVRNSSNHTCVEIDCQLHSWGNHL